MVSRTRFEGPTGGRIRRGFPARHARLAWLMSFCLILPALAGNLEDLLREELLGCVGTLKIDVKQPDYRPTIDTFGDLEAEAPVGTWVSESGEVHQISRDLESGIRDRKTALLEGDRVRIVTVDSTRRATDLTLALASNPEIRARLELRYSGSLRKNLSDVERVWAALRNLLDFSSDPEGKGVCQKEPAPTEEPGGPAGPSPGRPDP